MLKYGIKLIAPKNNLGKKTAIKRSTLTLSTKFLSVTKPLVPVIRTKKQTKQVK